MSRYNELIMAVDFDGTIVENDFPDIGKVIPNAIGVMKKAKKLGGRLILWTNREGDSLDEAVDFCKEQGIKFDAVNENISGLDFNPFPKVFATIYVDDKGNTLKERTPSEMSKIWKEIDRQLDDYKTENQETGTDLVDEYFKEKDLGK